MSTTLHGYTTNTAASNMIMILKTLLREIDIPVIAEGNVGTPEMFKRCLELGAASVVVGGAITRPKEITARFIEMIS